MSGAAWMVVLTFMFPGDTQARMSQKPCRDVICVADLESRAHLDRAVIRVQVYTPGTFSPIDQTSLPITAPIIDEWKL